MGIDWMFRISADFSASVRGGTEVPCANGCRPWSIVYAITPSAHTSTAISCVVVPSICSGDMYDAVPNDCPVPVTVWSLPVSLESPKSMMTTRSLLPSGCSITLDGFKSRCAMPCVCTAAIPHSICPSTSMHRSSEGRRLPSLADPNGARAA
eukprot:2962046-Rhodomonas_salina.1